MQNIRHGWVYWLTDPVQIQIFCWLSNMSHWTLRNCLINHNGNASEALIKNKFTFYLVIHVETEYETQY